MSPQAKPIPEGFSTITPYLIVRNAEAAIDFYKKAFGAQEISRQPGPDGKTILHATIKIGDSVLMLNVECPDWGCRGPESLGGTPVSIHLYVTDVDASFQRAIDAWGQALAIDPNHYIWRRRIQQYGPRLIKPYPFYDWVEQAAREIRARGETPVELAVRAIQYSSRARENVLDLFGGSGSTLIAAEQTERKAFLMELDPLYCDVIVQRFEKFTGKKVKRLSCRSNAPQTREALVEGS